jgi:hypothetical protein
VVASTFGSDFLALVTGAVVTMTVIRFAAMTIFGASLRKQNLGKRMTFVLAKDQY